MAIKTIIVRGNATEQHDEAIANGAINVGNLVELQSTGKVRKNAAGAGVVAPVTVAVEDDMQGNGIDDAYADAALVQYVHARPGDHINLVCVDGGSAIVIGDKIEPAAAGEVRKAATSSSGALSNPEAVIGIARSAVDASDSAATALASRRFVVEIM